MKKAILSWAPYGLLLIAGLALTALLEHWGSSGQAVGARVLGAASPRLGLLFHLLLALTAIMATGRLLGLLLKPLGQPLVIGEVLAGILLGPSLLGHLAPALGAFLLPADMAPSLGMVAQLGVILYMFQVGLELDASHLKGQGRAILAISHSSIVAPFVLGVGLALWLHPRFAPQGVAFMPFSLFMGVAMSITAFPVLARILTDAGAQHSRLGMMALSCAAVDDATAWLLLALVAGLAQAQLGQALWAAGGLLLFALAMALGLRPLLARALEHLGPRPLKQPLAALLLLGMLLSALVTELIGVHAIFGAFLLGAIIPHDSPAIQEFTGKLRDLTAILLLPAFFALTGMRTQMGLLDSSQAWLACGLIIAVACLGKLAGAFLAARFNGFGGRQALGLGILMNTRGLVELIVLNVGLDLKILSPELFSMMVLMALATTLATTPALRALGPKLFL